VEYAELLKALNIALPLGFQLIHIFTDRESGRTAVTILESGKAYAGNTQKIVEAWNKTFPAPTK
jgi:hypothetical protein